MSNTRFFVDVQGAYIGGFGDGARPDDPNATEVMVPPNNGRDVWDFDAQAWTTPAPDPSVVRAGIDAERDRRLTADFLFMGKMYQRDPESVKRIGFAATLAGFAMGAGAQPSDLFWHGDENPFVWIASDNSLTPMDAQTTLAFGQAAAAVETRLIFAAKALRDANPIPEDYTDDKWWP